MASSSSSSPPGEANEARNWAELPLDVTATILQKLGTVDILQNAQKVCMTWRRVSKDPAMWRSIDMRDLGDFRDMDHDGRENMARHAIDRSCGQLLDICIEDFGYELLQYFADRASQLKRLQIVSCYGISDEGLSEAAKKLPLLEELHICFCSISKEALKNVGRCCHKLKSLTFNYRGNRGPYDMEYDEEALAIAENMPGLHYLQLIGNRMTNDGLSAILDGCPHLETLDLRQCFNVHLGGALAKRCSEGIKNLRRPSDSTDDCGFDATPYDGYDDFSFDDEYPSGFSEIDFLSDVDEYYEFSGGSDISDYGDRFFNDF